ncbi:MAG TPA: cell division protein ZapA [Candidatus Binataceae bacterium]|nr:cell division protein ZapA [Candidatus Binataceae bacterium]
MTRVKVEIMGQNLVVASDADDEWVKAVAEAVDAKIKSIQEASRAVNSIDVAILAALNFADELERLKREHREITERIEMLTKRISASMEASE